MSDYIIKAISEDGSIRAIAINSTMLVRHSAEIHKTSNVVTAALGRLLSGCSMMGSMLKGDETLTVTVRGGGPVGGLTCVSNSKGFVRGYANNPNVNVPKKENGKLDVGAVVGKDGFLTVIKDLSLKEPYIGKCKLISGEIAEDLTSYFATSEQTPAACALGVLVSQDGYVLASGGYIIELMPNATEETISILEDNLNEIPSVTKMLSDNKTIEDILADVLRGISYKILNKQEVGYKCSCSYGKMRAALVSIGKDEIDDIIKTQGKAELHCHFCNKLYEFDKAFLEGLLMEIS